MEEEAGSIFELDRPSPYMLLVAPVRAEKRLVLTPEQQEAMRDPDLRRRVNVPRSELPAITHVDLSARIQTVNEDRNGRYYRLLREFRRQTGTGAIINTSFNIRGEPIVCTPQDAYRCFMGCDMDLLVLEDFILCKEEQPQLSREEKERYVESFQLD
jgi:carbamoyltransferase